MKKVSISQRIYNTIKVLPNEVQGEAALAVLAELFGDEATLSADGERWYYVVKLALDNARELSEKRAQAVRKRWDKESQKKQDEILYTFVNTKNIQKCTSIQNDLENNPEILHNEQDLYTFVYTKSSDAKVRKKDEEKEIENEKEIPPITPKEKEKEKEKEEERKSVCNYTRTHTREIMPRPTIEEVRSYILAMGYTFDAEQFCAFYTSNGWKVGKNPMKSWKAACRTWQGSRPRVAPKKNDLPNGLTDSEWSSFTAWSHNAIPALIITPDLYMDIRAIAHRKKDVVKSLLVEASKMGAGNLLENVKQLSNQQPFIQQIWTD